MGARQIPLSQLLFQPHSDLGRSDMLETLRHRLQRDIHDALADAAHDRVKGLLAVLSLEFQRIVRMHAIEDSWLRAKGFP